MKISRNISGSFRVESSVDRVPLDENDHDLQSEEEMVMEVELMVNVVVVAV